MLPLWPQIVLSHFHILWLLGPRFALRIYTIKGVAGEEIENPSKNPLSNRTI